jgi:hypothetical protein
MAIKHVRSDEVDTSDEIAKALNKIIDNVNLIEAKVEQMAGPKKKAPLTDEQKAEKKAAAKAKKDAAAKAKKAAKEAEKGAKDAK